MVGFIIIFFLIFSAGLVISGAVGILTAVVNNSVNAMVVVMDFVAIMVDRRKVKSILPDEDR